MGGEHASRAEAATADEIRQLERCGGVTWPALETEVIGTWELRFADGYTGRSNSVQATASESLDEAALDARIDACEHAYRERGLAPRFKLTSVAPRGLDARLEARGYARESATRVQTIGLEAPRAGADPEVAIAASLDARFVEAATRLGGIERASAWRAIAERIDAPRCATVARDGEVAAVGLGALHDGWMFLGSVATAEAARGQGWGSRIVSALLARGRADGARGGFLQVTEDNAVGLRLYQRLGFRDRYGYWYRALAH